MRCSSEGSTSESHLDAEPYRFQLLVAVLTGLVQPGIWANIDLRGREGVVFFRAMRLAILQVAQKRTPHRSNTQERTTRQDTLADTRTGHTQTSTQKSLPLVRGFVPKANFV